MIKLFIILFLPFIFIKSDFQENEETVATPQNIEVESFENLSVDINYGRIAKYGYGFAADPFNRYFVVSSIFLYRYEDSDESYSRAYDCLKEKWKNRSYSSKLKVIPGITHDFDSWEDARRSQKSKINYYTDKGYFGQELDFDPNCNDPY